MTPENISQKRTREVLEDILATVETIDRNVEEVREQLADLVADVQYGAWHNSRHYEPTDYE